MRYALAVRNEYSAVIIVRAHTAIGIFIRVQPHTAVRLKIYIVVKANAAVISPNGFIVSMAVLIIIIIKATVEVIIAIIVIAHVVICRYIVKIMRMAVLIDCVASAMALLAVINIIALKHSRSSTK